MKSFGREYSLYVDIVRHGLIRLEKENGGILFRYHPPQSSFPMVKLATMMALEVFGRGLAAISELYVVGLFLLEGPKYFEFDARSCEALEQFELGLASADYAQPFPTVMVALPADYAKNRVVPLTDRGYGLTQHKPECIIVRHDVAFRRVSILMHMDSGQVLSRVIHLDIADTVEECWRLSCRRWEGDQKTLDVNPEEEILSNALTRLGLSACLMAMVYELHPRDDNKSYRQRLERYVKVARKSGDEDRLAKAEWGVATLPLRYSFKQEVKFYHGDRHSRITECDSHGREVAPRWRRGHYRMQPYGPQNSLQKRIAIHPVLVNAHLFAGEAPQTEVRYKM